MSGAAAGPAVRVLICDDSAVVRGVMGRLLDSEPDMRVVGRAANGLQALETIRALPAADRPQVVLLDLEMPVMDGMTALPLLLREGGGPVPAVIVASALTQRGAAAAMAALRAGAADYIPKPSASGGVNDPAFRAELLAKLRGWARMAGAVGQAGAAPRPTPPPVPPRFGGAMVAGGLPPLAIAIGCSTGGPQALSALVQALGPAPLAMPVLVVQHMPPGFTTMLADHLGRLGGLPCSEARDGEALLPGRIYVAPGDRHLLAERAAADPRRLVARLSDSPPEHFCRPAVDPLLRGLVDLCGGRLVVAILTGMGQDGLEGCRKVAGAGGLVLAQDEASAVVWGMPGAVVRAGLAHGVQPPAALGAAIRNAATGGGVGPRVQPRPAVVEQGA